MPTAPLRTSPASAVSTRVLRAALYLRISKADVTVKADADPGSPNESAAIDRQRADGLALAQRRGWRIVDTYPDDGVSASGKAQRKHFNRMLADVRAGKIDTIIAWDLSRLTRNARDRLALVEACREFGVIVALVKGSDMDPTTASGRLVIGVLGEVAEMEIAMKSERQLRADQQRAQQGRMPAVSRYRPFGYRRDDMTVIPEEAEAIRTAAAEIMAGATLTGVARRWDEAGFRPTGGAKRWTTDSVRGALTHPRVAGLVTRHGEIVHGEDGEPVEAQWEPIIDDDLRRALSATIASERVVEVAKRGGGTTLHRLPGAHQKRGRPASSLLGGIARCACGSLVSAARATTGEPIYRCTRNAAAEGYSGSHVGSRSRVVADDHVRAEVLQRLADDDAVELIARKAPDAAPLRAERQTLMARLAEVADAFADGELSREQMRRANERVNGRLVEIDAAIAEAVRESVLASLVGSEDIVAAWDGLPVDRQRAAVRELCTVTLLPVDRSRPRAERENALSWVIVEFLGAE